MKRIQAILAAAILGLSTPITAIAADGHASHHQDEAKSGEAASPRLSQGEVKKVDKDAGKVTIKHGPLENLGMPGMTMIFRVKDPAMLDQMKEGDKINFVAEKVNGAFTVMQVEAAK